VDCASFDLYTRVFDVKYTKDLAARLERHEKMMTKNLDLTHRLVVSEVVMVMKLGESIGRNHAHDLVYQLCRQAEIEDEEI
jgi:3-carboxy-cis,cis-muconate cycloisomerase